MDAMSLHTVLFIICFEDLKKKIFFLFDFCKDLPSDCEICLKNWNVAMGTQFFFFLFITYHTFLVIVTRLNFFIKNLLCFSGSYKCKLENKRLCHILMTGAKLYSKCVCVQ